MDEHLSVKKDSLILAFDAKRLFNNHTGLGNYSRTLIKNLQQQYPQHQYHLYTPKIKINEETSYFLDAEKFTIHTPKNWNPIWRSLGMGSDINDLKPDYYHGLSHEIPFGISDDIKTVFTFHDLIYEKYPLQFGWWDRKMYQWKYKNSAHRSQYIISISESTKTDLIELYNIAQEKIHVIYQSCNEDFQNATPIQTKKYYLYVGSIIERKGLLQCVLAYAKLPNQYRKPFVVVGKGDNDYFQKVQDMIKYYSLEQNFRFINGLNNSELVSIYDQSFCLIYPSIYEGFGIPVIESLFRHKPVITSDLSSLPEASGPGAILINPFSPDELTSAMIRLHDIDTYASLAQKGVEYVSSQFNTQKTAEKLMEFYYKNLPAS